MSNCYPSAASLQNFQKDVETVAEYANGDNGVPNINRDGEDVGNLQTLNAQALEIAAGAANLQTYLTKAAMDADTSQPVNTVAQVTNDPDPDNNGYYVWNGSAWIVSGIQPASIASVTALGERVDNLDELIRDGDPDILNITNEEGALIANLDYAGLYVPSFSVDTTETQPTAIGDEEGGALLLGDEEGVYVGPLRIEPMDLPGVIVANEFGEVPTDAPEPEFPDDAAGEPPFDQGVLFGSSIAVLDGTDGRIDISSMLGTRSRAQYVVATLGANTANAYSESADRFLDLPAAAIAGNSLNMNLRDTRVLSPRYAKTVGFHVVGNQASPTAANVLVIGDSISNRQMLDFVNTRLGARNFSITWVGTINSSNLANNANNASGPLGETREGWEGGDFTGAITDRISIVEPGSEAGYLALTKTDKAIFNPFLRDADIYDDPADVRNGWILDFDFYQTRFSLAVPDVVVIATGTNDVRDRSAATVAATVLDNDQLMYRRLLEAWPTVKLIRLIPGTAADPAREVEWTTKYAPVIRSMMQAATEASATLASTWVMGNPEADYAMDTGTTDPVTGFRTTSWLDPIHPVLCGRSRLADSVAAYLGAKIINVI